MLRKSRTDDRQFHDGLLEGEGNELHTDFYLRKTLLDPQVIEESLGDVTSMLGSMEPLVGPR